MTVDDKTIEKYQEIYFREFGEKVSKEEAYKGFARLINVARVILHSDYESSEYKNYK